MAVLHPHVIPNVVIFAGALVIDSDSTRLNPILRRLVETRWSGTVERQSNFTVQRACKFSLFEGQHVAHHTYEPSDAYGDSYTTYYRFPRSVTVEEAEEWFDANDINCYGRECHHEYDCCGQWYSDGAYYPREHTRLVSIAWYRNV